MSAKPWTRRKGASEVHPLVQMQQVTRKEFLRGLTGGREDGSTRPLSDEDACRRIEPMNCISWIIGHMAHQEHAYFVAWPHGREIEQQYKAFGFGSPPSQPRLEETMALWRTTCEVADTLLHAADEESLKQLIITPGRAIGSENLGTLLTRNIFHYWSHIGEISAIRQMLGHHPPQFVYLHDWRYAAS
jgi:uncharacterized damage-inducible protein DinB